MQSREEQLFEAQLKSNIAENKLVAQNDKIKSHAAQLIEQLQEDSSEQSICTVKALIFKAFEVLKEDVKKFRITECYYSQGIVEAQLNILRALCEAINSHSNRLKFLPAVQELADAMASDEYFEKYWNKTHLHWMLVQHNFFGTLGNGVLDGRILECIFDNLEAAVIKALRC